MLRGIKPLRFTWRLPRRYIKQSANNRPDEYAALVAIKSDILRLMKDIMDRAIGAPKSSVDLSSEDGSMSPQSANEAFLAAMRAKHGDG